MLKKIYLLVNKVLKKIFDKDQSNQNLFGEMVNIMRQLDHPNIAKMLDFGSNEKSTYYIYDYCSRGSLEELINKHIKKNKLLEEEKCKKFIVQILKALEYMHTKNTPIMHRNINVLIYDILFVLRVKY
jgi:calcium-dependent protein kinase